MRPKPFLLCSALAFVVVSLWTGVSAQQAPQASPSVRPPDSNGGASLQIRLRLQDDSPFAGAADVRVISDEGHEVDAVAAESDGGTVFSDLQPGTYVVEVSAPGFLTVRHRIQIETGHGRQTLYVIMKPGSLGVHAPAPPAPVTTTPAAVSQPSSWLPPGVDEAVPPVEPHVTCPLPQLLDGVGKRMGELVSDLEKFSSNEQIEHFPVSAAGVRGSADVRNFEYLVLISVDASGFLVEEYRDSHEDPAAFPAHIATEGLPALALLFHPLMSPDFTFACEGLGQWDGHAAWQVYFVQRPDRPSRMRSYMVAGKYYPEPLKGRAWIDPGTYQVVRLEAESVRPIKEIQLTEEHLFIQYGAVQFHVQKQQLWLPQIADLYVERQGHRYYRRHSFNNFKIFMVETAQNIQQPQESYKFTNTSDRDIDGVLVVNTMSERRADSVSLAFTIPAGGTIYKLVGPGKDVNIPAESLKSATFTHDGPADSIKVDTSLVKESVVDVIPLTPVHP
jgi:hypothetical protein